MAISLISCERSSQRKNFYLDFIFSQGQPMSAKGVVWGVLSLRLVITKLQPVMSTHADIGLIMQLQPEL